MLDTGAGSSYISSSLLTKLNLKPDRVERRVIEQMYGTVDKKLELYKVILESNTVNTFNMELQVINAEKPVLTNLPNPRIADQKNKYNHIKRLVFSEETATQDKLPVHIILGAADVQRIKSTEPPVLGPNPDTDPGAEFTMLGWVLAGKAISPTTESEKSFFVQSSHDEFTQMCSQEVLGLADVDDNKDYFHKDFKDRLAAAGRWNILHTVTMET